MTALALIVATHCCQALDTRGADIYWVGDQTGPFSIDKSASGWSFYEGVMWEGFRPPGIVYNGGPQVLAGDSAIFDSLRPYSTGEDLNLSNGGTIYFGDFTGRQNNTIQPWLYYDAQNLINDRLYVRNGQWKFDFAPAASPGGEAGTHFGSYKVQEKAYIGYTDGSNASLEVRNGEMTIGELFIAPFENGAGEMRVTGPLTRLTVLGGSAGPYGGIRVADLGEGSFIVEGGAKVTSGRTWLGTSYAGMEIGSVGHVIARGAGTELITTGWSIGGGGVGTLLVENGAKARHQGEITTAFLGVTGSGTATVRGTSSAWTGISTMTVGGNYASPGGTGELHVLDGGLVSAQTVTLARSVDSVGEAFVSSATANPSSWNISSTLVVGEQGSGEVEVGRNGFLNSSGGTLGVASGAVGKITIANGGRWNNTWTLDVGIAGEGELAVADSKVTSAATQIGVSAGSIGEISVSGASAEWNNGSRLVVGAFGAGAFNVTGGGKVLNTDCYIARFPGSTGIATISGSGSTWTSSDAISIGQAGNGTLRIENGAAVLNTSADIGNLSRGVGAVTVTGKDSSWTNSGYLLIGNNGAAALTIEDGGKVTNTFATLAQVVGSTATVTVSGPNSKWTNSDVIEVGYGGHGVLTILNGAEVYNGAFGRLGLGAEAFGSVVVSGANSAWSMGGGLYVENGDLNIQAGGKVASNSGYLSFGTAKATISGADSQWLINQEAVVGSYGGYTSGSGQLEVASGGLLAIGDYLLTGPDGTVDVSQDGMITIGDATPISDAIVVGYRGSLSGNGSIVGDVIIDAGGLVSPGSSPGTLHIAGDFIQTFDGYLTFEIGGLAPSQYDQLDVSGDVSLDGNVNVVFIDGFRPNVGDKFDLFKVGGEFNSNATIYLYGAPHSLRYSAGVADGIYAMTITAVPEPGTVVLSSIALAILFARRLGSLGKSSRIPSSKNRGY